MFSKSLTDGSVAVKCAHASPAFAPLTRNSMPNVVLPEPQVPAARTVEPYGIPPLSISSSPCTPVTHLSREYIPIGCMGNNHPKTHRFMKHPIMKLHIEWINGIKSRPEKGCLRLPNPVVLVESYWSHIPTSGLGSIDILCRHPTLLASLQLAEIR